jgi:hypothetical protein
MTCGYVKKKGVVFHRSVLGTEGTQAIDFVSARGWNNFISA